MGKLWVNLELICFNYAYLDQNWSKISQNGSLFSLIDKTLIKNGQIFVKMGAHLA